MSEAIRKSAAPLRRPAPQEAPKGTPGERASSLGAFPQVRLRRNGTAGRVRRLVAENRLGTADLIWPVRSEGHTSELQSLMRLPSAVFCLNKQQYGKADQQQ